MNRLQQEKQRLITKIDQQRLELNQWNSQLQLHAVRLDQRWVKAKQLYRTIIVASTVFSLIKLFKKSKVTDKMTINSEHTVKKQKLSVVLLGLKLIGELFL